MTNIKNPARSNSDIVP